MVSWLFADIGFDTNQKLWFIDFYDSRGRPNGWVGHVNGSAIVLHGTNGKQFEWREDQDGSDYYHVRERIYGSDVQKIEKHPGLAAGDDLSGLEGPIEIWGKKGTFTDPEGIPDAWKTLRYAYDLQTSRGFVEFLDKDGAIISRTKERWIIVEHLDRETVGAYPNIRFEVKREQVLRLVVTDTAAVILGHL